MPLMIVVLGLSIMDVALCSDQSICLIGYANLKTIRLKLTLGSQPTVQYFGQKEKTNIVLLKEEELKRNQDRPSLFQTEWEEVYKGQKTGRYIMVSQGAVIYHFVYLRHSDQKVFFFEQDPDIW